jgi:acyl-CoA reductase-like NAD-dependent aldehyde dehydrogenase
MTTPTTDPRTLAPKLSQPRLLVGGRLVAPRDGGSFPVVNPATGEKLCDAPAASAADVDGAVKAARRAFDGGPWRRMSARDRGRLIRRLADLLWERREDFALVESLENGKTFREALRGDVGSGAACLAHFSEEPVRLRGEVLPVDGPFHTYVVREPVGVAGAIVPWNYPTSLACWKLGPALATGCTVVLKPSELTPLTAMKLGELSLEAGLPDGVLNVVPGLGDPAGEAIARHPGVDKVSFTGSIRTARRIVAAAGETNLKRLTLELGGKSPHLVLPDADLDRTVEAVLWGIFGNKGETCNAGSRVVVHARVHDALVEALTARARALRVGDPLDPATEVGSLVSRRQLETVLGYVRAGREEGATLLTGGDRDLEGAKARGFFVRPAVFTGVAPGMTIAQEEIFGPVVSILKVSDEDEAVAVANGTRYGLAAAIWTRDVARAHALARRLEAGVVWINCFNEFDDAVPFGGFKESGWGRDLSHHALDGFLQQKAIWTKLPE